MSGVRLSRRRLLHRGLMLTVGLTSVSGLLAACSGSTATPAKPAETKPADSKPAAAATAAPSGAAPAKPAAAAKPAANQAPATTGPQTVPFFSTETDPIALKATTDAAASFQKENPNITVNVVLGASAASRGEALVRSFTVGQELGIFELEDYFREDWVKAGYLVPLDDIVKEIGEDDMTAGSMFRAADGKIYGIPTQINPMRYWMRTDLVEKAGLKEPTNVQEFVEVAKALTTGNQYGTGFALGPNRATSTTFFPIVNQHGGDYYDKQGNLTFDQPQVLEAIQRMVELLNTSPPGAPNFGYTEMTNAYLAGTVAFGRSSGQSLATLVEKAPQMVPNTKVLMHDPLGGPLNGKVSWGRWTQIGISANTKSIEAAKAFLKYFVTGARAENWVTVTPGKVSPLASINEKILKSNIEFVTKHKALIEPYFEAAKTAVTPDSNMGSVTGGKFEKTSIIMPWAAQLWGGTPVDAAMLQKIVIGKESPEEAWKWASGEMKKAADEWKAANPNWKPAG